MIVRPNACLTLFRWLTTASVAAQSELAIDFGSTAFQSSPPGETWNNVTSLGTGVSTLRYTNNVLSSITLQFTTGKTPVDANLNGVEVPSGGSELAALGWPASAMRDSFYGDAQNSEIEFTLSGLDPTGSYDFEILASRVGAADMRTTWFSVQGTDTANAVLNASCNDSEVATISGIRPTAGGQVSFFLRPGTTNDNNDSFYYLNALEITEWTAGSQPPLVAFDYDLLETSRADGSGPFAWNLATYTNDGTQPALGVTVLDADTGVAPTWLTVPASPTAGAPIPITIDASSLTLGKYAADITAQAAGYTDATMKLTLDVRATDKLNILMYGNSYSFYNGGVNNQLGAVATEGGYTKPCVVGKFAAGQTLNFHLNDPVHSAAITQGIQVGENWDWVVLQGQSLEATVDAGDPSQFLADAVAIVTNVRSHSPNARACLFQTWARTYGSFWYPTVFANPLAMHGQIEAGYLQAVADIDAAFGAGTARRAAVGQAAALRNFDATIYDPDLSHPDFELTVMAASTIFTAIYGDSVCDFGLDLSAPTGLAVVLNELGLTQADWLEIAGTTERSANPEDRRFPGSREDLLLRSALSPLGSSPFLDACPLTVVEVGDLVTFEVSSPVGTYDAAPTTVWADLYRTGNPPTGASPEIHFDASAWIVASAPNLGSPLQVTVRVEPWMAGKSLVVQAQASQPSALTGNAFTTTDGHELRVKPLKKGVRSLWQVGAPGPTPGR